MYTKYSALTPNTGINGGNTLLTFERQNLYSNKSSSQITA